jgi:endonuclease YncB( thermonuclease family)
MSSDPTALTAGLPAGASFSRTKLVSAVRAIAALLLCWTLTAEPGRVVDGDTFDAKVHKYLREFRFERIRVLPVQTPEVGKPGYAEAKAFAKAWLEKGPVTIRFCEDDFNGRLLAHVTRGPEDLGQLLLDAKHAVPWAPRR